MTNAKSSLEALNDQVGQKNARIRELEEEAEKIIKSQECLQKDLRYDVQAEDERV